MGHSACKELKECTPPSSEHEMSDFDKKNSSKYGLFPFFRKNYELPLAQELLLEASESVLTRTRQRVSTLFKENVNKIPSLREATKD